MEPASTRMSSPVSLSSRLNRASSAPAGMAGPCPLISVSSPPLSFTLMRVKPSSRWMKSVMIPS